MSRHLIKFSGILRWVVLPASIFFSIAAPIYAINNESSMFADPARYFPGCTCQVAFLSFVVWMITLLIIAMFQYGDTHKRKLTAFWFSIIAIILAFIIYSIPLGGMLMVLKPASFELNTDTGLYMYSLYGEKSKDTKLKGEYTQDEVIEHIRTSRTGVITSWIILGVICAGAMLSIPAYLKRSAERKKQPPPVRKKRRRTSGGIGSRRVKQKKEKDKKGKKGKGT